MKEGEYTSRNLISDHSKCVLVLWVLVICVGLEKHLYGIKQQRGPIVFLTTQRLVVKQV